MKRKIFSKLLMVALVIAAVGSFVSCKDYDDDINNLQKQIDAKAAISELTALQSTLDSKIAAAQSAAAAAQATADAAATKTAVADLKTALEAAIADAKKAGTDAGTQAGEAITKANKAQETAEGAAQAAKDADAAAKKALEEALAKIAETYETKADAAAAAAETKTAIEAVKEALAAVKATADAAFTKAEAEKLQEQVNNLKADLESQIEEKVNEAIKNVDKAVASVDAIWSAVTSVELIDSFTGTAQGITLNDEATPGTLDVTILHGTIGEESIFGDNEALYAGNIWATGEPQKNYAKDGDINFESGVIVRVNPANADITNAKILLVNSLGEALDDYVVVKSVEPYSDLITRGSTINTGLWKVNFTMVEGKTIKDVQQNTYDGRTYNAAGAVVAPGTQILYAVAVNNTDENDANRYVVSSYDVGVDADVYTPAFTFGFNVNKKAVEDIANRWYYNTTTGAFVTKAEDGEYAAPLEYQWNNSTAARPTPATAIAFNNTGAAQNASPRATGSLLADDRYGNKYLPVQVDVPFTVSGIIGYKYADAIAAYWTAAAGYINQSAQIEWYYVVLDEPRAISSHPSEINAWKSYEYEGLGVMTPASKSLNITIKSAQANGDIIGFRVFAVNYDGTLADPDGRAFYVAVGNAADGGSIDVAYTANDATATLATASAAGVTAHTKNVSAVVAVPASVYGKFNTTTAVANWANYGSETFLPADYPSDVKVGSATGVKIHYGLYQNANASTPSTSWADVRYVKVVAEYVGEQVDNSILPIVIEGKDANDRVINTLTINVQKLLPTSGATVAWRTTMGPDADGVLTVYPSPADGNFSNNASTYVQTITAGTNNPQAGTGTGEWNITWPTATALPGTNVTCAVVDLGGYAIDLNKDVYDWEITGLRRTPTANATTTGTVLLPGVDYSSAALAGQGQFALAISKNDMNNTFDSKIYATYPGVSLASSTATSTQVRFAAWEGKIKFASIFNDLFQYGNGSYSAWALNPVKDNALKTDFYYFYGEPGILQGKFDVDNFVVSYRAAATGVTEADVQVAPSAITQSKYMDIIGTGYYADAAAFTSNTLTSNKNIKTFDGSYTTTGWGVAYSASGTTTTGGTSTAYSYFAAWNETTYPARKVITVDWAGTTTDEKQTSKLKARNSGLDPEAAGTTLDSYITIGNGDCTLTSDAATVMTATINATEDLVLANRAGNVVTAKKADQKITLKTVKDQFGLLLTTQPSINFTLMPETSGVENGK